MNRKGGKTVQRASRPMRGFVALIALAGAMSLFRCSPSVQPTIASDLNNQSFTFSSGAVFNPGLANIETTVAFSNDAATFTLSAAGGRAAGGNNFGNACSPTVLTRTFSVGIGAHVNDAIRLFPCDFDIPNNPLLVGNGTTTATSSPGVPIGA